MAHSTVVVPLVKASGNTNVVNTSARPAYAVRQRANRPCFQTNIASWTNGSVDLPIWLIDLSVSL